MTKKKAGKNKVELSTTTVNIIYNGDKGKIKWNGINGINAIIKSQWNGTQSHQNYMKTQQMN